MDPNLIIDDEYITEVGKACKARGKKMEEILDKYIEILDEIRVEAITKGNISEAINAYVGCAKLLNNQISEISSSVNLICKGFITDVNSADEYLF